MPPHLGVTPSLVPSALEKGGIFKFHYVVIWIKEPHCCAPYCPTRVLIRANSGIKVGESVSDWGSVRSIKV